MQSVAASEIRRNAAGDAPHNQLSEIKE